MKLLILTILFFIQINLNVFADTVIIFQISGVDHIFVPYQDDTEWVIDEFQITEGHLQEKINTWRYSTINDYQEKILELKAIEAENGFKTSTKDFVETENLIKKLWVTKAEWNTGWENKFAEFIESEVDQSFFTQYNISTDCADAMIALRWIFARIHGLAMGSTLAGSGVLITNESFKNSWNNLPRSEVWYEDQAFLTAIDYIMDNAYTNSLWADSFPVAIKDEYLHAGTFFLYKTNEYISGHTQIILRSEKKFIIAESTVPRRVRDLVVRNFYPPTPVKDYSGLRTFKWLKKDINGKKYLLAEKDHPNYSQEQYDSALEDEFGSFHNAVFYRLGLKYNYRKHIRNLKQMLKNQLKTRVDIIKDGFEVCSRENCSPGTANYENWSTPSRDKRIKEAFFVMNKTVEKMSGKMFKRRYVRYLKSKKLKLDKGKKMSYQELQDIFLNDHFSSDPTRPIADRWYYKEE